MINIKVGDLLGGKYEVLQILGGEGKSGMGIVYICLNIDHNNFFALKTFQDKFLFSKEMKDSFKREALAWVQLEQHPNIVQAIAFEELDYRNFIILEYIAPDGTGLVFTIEQLTQISYDDILKWSLQFCYGMEHASSHGVISHRDIKPDNIMVEIGKNIKITDFGLVKVVDETISDIKEPYEGEHSVSKDGFIAGTPPWMAPEQFVGKADIRSDVYSFGVVLFQMVKRGELPFTGTSIKEFQIAHSKKPIPQIDNELFPIIEYCLQKNPEDRYQNFKELRKDLEDLYREKIGTSLPSPPNKAELNISSIFNKGLSFQNLNLIDQAIQEYRKGLTIKPDNISILNQLEWHYKIKES